MPLVVLWNKILAAAQRTHGYDGEDILSMARLGCCLCLDLGVNDAVPQYVPVVILEFNQFWIEATSVLAPNGEPGCPFPPHVPYPQTIDL